MPSRFVHLDTALEEACREAVVLTTTERLRRNLVRAFNDRQLAGGRRAWPTPRVETLDNHLARQHDRLRSRQPDLPELLGPEAEFQQFRATAPQGAAELVPLAQQAWQICHHWRIPLSSPGLGATDNGRLFVDWCERLQRRLSAQGAITRAELPAQPYLETDAPELVCLVFEHLPRAHGDWLQRQAAAGRRVRDLPAGRARSAQVMRTTFNSPAEELAVVAQWTRGLLETGMGDVSIGIVVPDLARRHTAVLRQLTAELDPGLQTGGQGLLDIGSGTPLGGQPIWLAARQWLTMCFDRLPAAEARRTLNSRYLTLPPLPSLPASLPPYVDLRRLTRETGLPGLEEALAALPAQGVTTPMSEWLVTFGQVLGRGGWNASQAGSVQYQAWQEIRARLDALSRTADPRPCSAMAALALADQFLHSVIFAPERAAAPVQVMGYLETTGLAFTHLWVTGLTDQSWPQLPQANPFLPSGIRRAHGVPRTTPEEEAGFAAERLRHWQAATENLILSHPRQDQESELRPSPLIRAFPEVDFPDYHPQRPHPALVHRPGQLEWVADERGARLTAGTHRGGTGRIRDQATCPFRGYAIHRLDVKEPRLPHGLPDALDRGTLIHEALHRLYENAGAAGCTPAELDAADFARAADRALTRHYSRFPGPFRDRERRRLIALLEVWNRLERDREGVEIEALELDVRAEFHGIGLRLRIDRVDRLNEALIVIDYKTGRIGHRLGHERLLDPQLPLYALTNPDIQGVLYAEVDEQRPRLKGIAAVEVPEASIDPPEGNSWTAQRAIWQAQIDTLTREVTEGVATVTPHDSRACQNCHLQTFCRVSLDVDERPG